VCLTMVKKANPLLRFAYDLNRLGGPRSFWSAPIVLMLYHVDMQIRRRSQAGRNIKDVCMLLLLLLCVSNCVCSGVERIGGVKTAPKHRKCVHTVSLLSYFGRNGGIKTPSMFCKCM
jgi:hypothetical protein